MPVNSDSSHQTEQTILLSEEEFKVLSSLAGKKVSKVRYYYPVNGRVAEVDVFQGELEGLVLIDFEFSSMEEKENFIHPDFCLVDITQEEFIAGGFLAGKKYADIEENLKVYNYQIL